MNIGEIVGVISGLVSIVALVIAIVFYFKQKKDNKKFQKENVEKQDKLFNEVVNQNKFVKDTIFRNQVEMLVSEISETYLRALTLLNEHTLDLIEMNKLKGKPEFNGIINNHLGGAVDLLFLKCKSLSNVFFQNNRTK